MAKNKQKSSKPGAAAAASTNSQDTVKPAKAAQSVSNQITPKLVGVSNNARVGTPVQPSSITVTISVEFGTSA